MILSPGRSPKQHLPGIGLHDPLYGRQACPEFVTFDQGVGQICPRWRLFSCRFLPKRGQICYIPYPPPPIVELVFTTAWVTLLDVGGEDDGALPQARRLVITTEMKKMAEDLSSYMREHYNTLIYKEAAVRRRVKHAANKDLLEFVGEIADMARELRASTASLPPLKVRVGR